MTLVSVTGIALLASLSCASGQAEPPSDPTATVEGRSKGSLYFHPTPTPVVGVKDVTPTHALVPTNTLVPTLVPTATPFHTVTLVPTPTPTQSPTSLLTPTAVPIPTLIPTPTPEIDHVDILDQIDVAFLNLSIGQTNRGTIDINGHTRHVSVMFPASYDNAKTYPVVLYFHGCMCKSEYTKEDILGYLDHPPDFTMDPGNEFIVIKLSAYSEKKDRPTDRGKWFWHEGLSDRDDFIFVHALIKALQSSPDIKMDPDNIFGVGHSSGAIFLLSFVLGGPLDLSDVNLNDTYTFEAISVSGG